MRFSKEIQEDFPSKLHRSLHEALTASGYMSFVTNWTISSYRELSMSTELFNMISQNLKKHVFSEQFKMRFVYTKYCYS